MIGSGPAGVDLESRVASRATSAISDGAVHLLARCRSSRGGCSGI